MQSRQATTFRADSSVMAELDRLAQRTGLSRNDVLNLIVQAGIRAGIYAGLAASGVQVREAEHVTGEDGR